MTLGQTAQATRLRVGELVKGLGLWPYDAASVAVEHCADAQPRNTLAKVAGLRVGHRGPPLTEG